jgi:hypothetical protein
MIGMRRAISSRCSVVGRRLGRAWRRRSPHRRLIGYSWRAEVAGGRPAQVRKRFMDTVEAGGLSVAKALYDFMNDEALPG